MNLKKTLSALALGAVLAAPAAAIEMGRSSALEQASGASASGNYTFDNNPTRSQLPGHPVVSGAGSEPTLRKGGPAPEMKEPGNLDLKKVSDDTTGKTAAKKEKSGSGFKTIAFIGAGALAGFLLGGGLIGALIGAVAGGLLGRLFGKKKK